MSRGLGKLQRAILDDLQDGACLGPTELRWVSIHVYQKINDTESFDVPYSFRVSVRRAISGLEKHGFVMTGYAEGIYSQRCGKFIPSTRSCIGLVKYVWIKETKIKEGWSCSITQRKARKMHDESLDMLVGGLRELNKCSGFKTPGI